MKKWQNSIWGERRKKGKCKDCAIGQVYEYKNYGGSSTIKCDFCGSSQEN